MDIWFEEYTRLLDEYEDRHPDATWEEINREITDRADRAAADRIAAMIDAARS